MRKSKIRSRSIGGYLELELSKSCEYHPGAIKLNSGRNALYFMLSKRKYKKIYIPYFSCDAIMKCVDKLGISHTKYHINSKFEPELDVSKLDGDEVLLYINYFGMMDDIVTRLSKVSNRIIVDNSQAFFSMPTNNLDTFYSPRKFFGIPDGGYAYCCGISDSDLDESVSYNHIEHLTRRIDQSAEVGFYYFKMHESQFDLVEPRRMSKLTQRILESIDYEDVRLRRRANYECLEASLHKVNEIKLKLVDSAVPLSYPLLVKNKEIKASLQSNSIYCASYWPNVKFDVNSSSLEYLLADDLIHLPIDQRYGVDDMRRILSVVNS